MRFAPSASDSFRQPFSFALRMRFSIATYSFPQQLLIHRPRHIGQDARPIHNRPCPAPPPAPSDGTVLAVNIRPGEFATIGGSTPPVLLGRLDPLHVRVDIDEADVP